MPVRGTIAGESMDITGSGNSATIGNAVAGFGCTQLGGVVQCTRDQPDRRHRGRRR